MKEKISVFGSWIFPRLKGRHDHDDEMRSTVSHTHLFVGRFNVHCQESTKIEKMWTCGPKHIYLNYCLKQNRNYYTRKFTKPFTDLLKLMLRDIFLDFIR